MNYSIVTTPEFDKNLKRLSKKYASMKNDFTGLLQSLQTKPDYDKSEQANISDADMRAALGALTQL